VDSVPDPLLFILVVPGIEPGPPDLNNRYLCTYIEGVVFKPMYGVYESVRAKYTKIIILRIIERESLMFSFR
jgi:hypothetical protein